jgi:proteic killer suppression protein
VAHPLDFGTTNGVGFDSPGSIEQEGEVFSFVTLDVTRTSRYCGPVIISYRDKRTGDFAAGKWVKAFSGFARSARLKLDRLEAAASLRDLAALPGNRFEALHGDRKGQYSIRINDHWRICFEWHDDSPGPSNVEIVDYH